jgi:high-affinity K+ transport system ATPase subunit B
VALVKNVSPMGDLEIPALGLVVAAGASVEIADDVAENLLEQVGTWAVGDSKKSTSTPAPDAPDAK